MTFERDPSQPPAAATEAIEAMPALRAAWGDPSAERCVLLPGGGWLVQRRGQLQRQPDPLPARAAGALLQTLSAQHSIVSHGWRIDWADGDGGGVAWMERAPDAQAQAWDSEACNLLLQAMRRGVRAVIFGAPWSTHDQLLSWAAAHHHAEHPLYVADALPQGLDAARVLHLYPPADGAARGRIARLLDGAPAVFWARVEGVDALRVALGPAGAQSRWISVNALDPVEAASSLLSACHDAHLPAPDLLAFVERGAAGAPIITRLQLLEAGQRTTIYSAAPEQPAPPQPIAAPQPVAAPQLQEPAPPPANSLRTSAELALRELGVSPGEAAYQPAASTINELFEDSESDAALVRESGELTAQAALMAQAAIHIEEPSDPDATSELRPLSMSDVAPRFETPLFGTRQIARAASDPSMPALMTPASTSVLAPTPRPAEVIEDLLDDDPATRELYDMDLDDVDPPAPPRSEPVIDVPPAAASRIRDTLDEAPPLIQSSARLQIPDDAALARVSGEDFVLEEYLQQRATREADASERVEQEALKIASLVDLGELDDAVTGNVPGKLLQQLMPQLGGGHGASLLPEATASEQPALDAIEELDDLYALELPPARMESVGTEPSLRVFQSIPQSDVLAMTSPNLNTPGALAWNEDEDTHHKVLDDELASTDPHKRTLPAEAAAVEDTQSRRSALSQRLRALSQQRQSRSEVTDDAPPSPHDDQTRQQSVNKDDLLRRLRQELQDDDL